MHSSSNLNIHHHHATGDAHTYKLRVRNKVYLWGSSGILADATFDSPLLFHLHNDLIGEAITIGTQKADGSTTVLGVLEKGQCFSIQIQNIAAIYAECASESTIICSLGRR